MRTMQLNLGKSQFVNMFNTMNDIDKLEIYNELKKSLLLNRFENLLKSLRTDELSMEDITKEVESVRKKRYEEGRQCL